MKRATLSDAYRDIFFRHPEPMWVHDVDTLRFVEVNESATKRYGYTREDFLSLTVADLHPEEERQSFLAFNCEPDELRPRSSLWRHRHASGETFYVDIAASSIEFDGRPARLVLATDATSRLAVVQALSESRAALAEAQELAHLGSFETDLITGETTWSTELYRMLGVAPSETPVTLFEFDHADDIEDIQAAVERAKIDRTPYTVDHRIVTRSGAERYVQERGQFFYDSAGNARRCVGAVLDITERKLAEERLAYLAYHDALTELPNRAQLNEKLVQAVARARRTHKKFAVLFADLDRFKIVNDSIGHVGGDRLLRRLAERIQAAVGPDVAIARPGGDEFVAVLENTTEAGAQAAAHRLLETIAEPLPYGDTNVVLTACVGVALYPEDGATPEELLRGAAAAMFAAKTRGGSAVERFLPEMERVSRQQLALETALRTALDNGAIDVAYQPILDATDGRVLGVEALARWTSEERIIDPSDFIPLAEETGLIGRLGTFVLERSCRQMRELQRLGYGELTVAVNISARQFREANFVEHVAATLERTGLAGEHLVFEITESAYIVGLDAARRSLEALRAMGISVSIDDFGTGYSSLGYLKRLPLDGLKIDRSFVADILTDPADQAIVRAIVAVAHNLRLHTIAEGVETREQGALLRGIGCDRLQGYYFSRPLGPAQLVAYLEAQMPPRASP